MLPSLTTKLEISQICPSKSKVVSSTPSYNTIMSQHPRRNFPGGNSRKGKLAEVDKSAAPKAAEPPPSNGLLAGYLAHEFLTKGTLLGRRVELDSARPDLSGSTSVEQKRIRLNSPTGEVKPSAVKEHGSYEEVANLLKIKGTCIKGIVNPTQLSNWINK